MGTEVHTDLDLLGVSEIQNAIIQNLSSAPTTNLVKGRFYFNTSDNTLYVYNGTAWVNALVQGTTYTEGNGIDITGNVISIDNTVTGATKCKITYNAQGLVTAGADLSTTDIPDLSATYVATTQLGANSGVATLGSDGKVPSSQLPSFVDDVVDAYIVSGATALSSGWLSATDGGAALTPETGKIYVVLTTGAYQNKTYRWSGSTYVEISASPGAATESAAGIIELATQTEVNTGTDDTRAVTPLKLATLLSNRNYTTSNPALTVSSGVCTWTVTHNLASNKVGVHIYNATSGKEIIADVVRTSTNVVTIKLNSSADITAGTYDVVVIGK